MTKLLDEIHPGEILLEDYLKPLGITARQLAADIDVPPSRISEIVNGHRPITADTALRLGMFFSMESRFWLNLQTEYDLRVAAIDECESRGRRAVLQVVREAATRERVAHGVRSGAPSSTMSWNRPSSAASACTGRRLIGSMPCQRPPGDAFVTGGLGAPPPLLPKDKGRPKAACATPWPTCHRRPAA